jgi:hypothetical protein
MDELKDIRDLLPEQAPPSARVVAQARARLTEAPRRSVWPRLVIPLAAAAAVAAVVVVSLPQGSDDQAGTGQQPVPAAVPTSAKDILLVAAERADTEAAKTGRFWHVRTMTGAQYQRGPLGTAPDTYNLDQRTVTEAWLSATGSDKDWTGQRNVGVRPSTPADEAAWRAAGSPGSWNLGYDAEIGRDYVLTTKPEAGSLFERSPLQQVVPGMTAQQLRDLPTDVARLREFLIKNRAAGRDEPQDPEGKAQVVENYLFSRAVMLLAEAPASPGVRAAALRLIADLGGVKSSGPVTDPVGRKGTGITLVNRTGTASDTIELVIDPANGTLLSSRHTGAEGGRKLKQSYVVVLSTGWTDAKPTIPSADVN